MTISFFRVDETGLERCTVVNRPLYVSTKIRDGLRSVCLLYHDGLFVMILKSTTHELWTVFRTAVDVEVLQIPCKALAGFILTCLLEVDWVLKKINHHSVCLLFVFFFFFFLWSDNNHHVDYFVTLRRVSSAKKQKREREREREEKRLGLLQSGGPWCVDGLGLSDFLGQVIPVSDGLSFDKRSMPHRQQTFTKPRARLRR